MGIILLLSVSWQCDSINRQNLILSRASDLCCLNVQPEGRAFPVSMNHQISPGSRCGCDSLGLDPDLVLLLSPVLFVDIPADILMHYTDNFIPVLSQYVGCFRRQKHSNASCLTLRAFASVLVHPAVWSCCEPSILFLDTDACCCFPNALSHMAFQATSEHRFSRSRTTRLLSLSFTKRVSGRQASSWHSFLYVICTCCLSGALSDKPGFCP